MSIREYFTPRSFVLMFVFSPGMFLGFFVTPASERNITTMAYAAVAACVMSFLYVLIFALFDFLRGCSTEEVVDLLFRRTLWFRGTSQETTRVLSTLAVQFVVAWCFLSVLLFLVPPLFMSQVPLSHDIHGLLEIAGTVAIVAAHRWRRARMHGPPHINGTSALEFAAGR